MSIDRSLAARRRNVTLRTVTRQLRLDEQALPAEESLKEEAVRVEDRPLHRAGLDGLNRMQQGARAVLDAGGAASLAGRRQLRALEGEMLSLRASPGGAADLLAATLFLDRLTPSLAPTGSN